jgi:hypothetical protein
MKTLLKSFVFLALIGLFPIDMFAWDGMSTPMLHVEGRYLKDPSGKNVTLHGWMQPDGTWFNGEGNRYSDATDWTNPGNVAGMLNFLKDAANIMSDPSPKYGRSHGWYASFVRLNCGYIGGFTAENGLVNQAQFNGWIQNFIVPYANHLRSRGLYLVICATGPVNTPNNGTHNAGMTEQARLRTFWSTVANASGIKNADNIMFELMNEPVQIESSPGNGQWGSGSGTYFNAFKNWTQPIINDIRNTGANNVIWVSCLGWQGEPHGWAQYPFTGSNIGVACHLYPAYGGVYNNAAAMQNLWNSNYKPAADRWPMIITECMWYPGGTGYEDLFNGTTAGFGNNLKNAIDNQGNVSFLVGFLADHLVNLVNTPLANTSLGTHEGTQAFFDWLPGYQSSAPGGGGCTPTAITPYIQVNDGTWQQASSVTVNSGDKIIFGPQPVSGGSWNWSGCGTSGTSREQTVYPTSTCMSTATYTNSCGAQSTQNFNVTVSGSSSDIAEGGVYRITPRNGGKAVDVAGCGTADGTNVQNWTWLNNDCQQWQFNSISDGYWKISPAYATGKAMDVSGVSTADGANIHIWNYVGGNNQQWQVVNLNNGYYQIVARHSGKCLDLDNGSTADGANIKQWTCSSSNTNQHFTFSRLKSIKDVLPEGLTEYKLYPSPANENLNITFRGQDNVNVRIYNSVGTMVHSSSFTGNSKTLDVSKLSNGIYFIKLEGNKKIITDRFIKK